MLTLFISVGCTRLKERSLFASRGDGEEALGEETRHVEEEAAHQSQPVVAREEVAPSAAGEEAAAGQGGSRVSGQKEENHRLLPLHKNNLYQLQI